MRNHGRIDSVGRACVTRSNRRKRRLSRTERQRIRQPTLPWRVPTLSGYRASASGLTEPQERVEFPATWEVIRKVSIFVFGLLTDADVAWMARAGVQRPIKDQEILIQEGRPLESVIFLLQGECMVTEHVAGEIARLGVGEVVGEMSFLDSAPPSATVTAVGDGLALLLDKETLARRLEADVAFGCRFYRALAIHLADRMRGTVRRMGGAPELNPKTVAKDELDSRNLDVVSMARDRFDRLLKMLVGER
jgi:CRP/FNR family transcriptional regulator, cyclic AMP receptor protein